MKIFKQKNRTYRTQKITDIHYSLDISRILMVIWVILFYIKKAELEICYEYTLYRDIRTDTKWVTTREKRC